MLFSNLFNNNNNNNNIFIYISGLLGVGGKIKGKDRKKGMGEAQGRHKADVGSRHPRVFVDPIVKQPPIMTKFQMVIVFNVVNTSTKSNFRSHG